MGLVHRCLGHLAVAQFPDERYVWPSVNFEAARSTYTTHVVPHDDLAARRNHKVDRRELESLERLRDVAYVASECVAAAIDALLGSDGPRKVKDGVGRRDIGERVPIASADCRVSRPHDLHVLAGRHELSRDIAPPSIPRRGRGPEPMSPISKRL